ncbi:putative serine/threonine-protein kinase NAK [Acorus gramineus]|uniref:Serine/threonine-protein kinase NAK n=1 Tax=Acorus gramineus TaxID=55184 RepID=A0AAV9AP93_ACOGR|nr:putative serine/threonine-protein kinase NAK [Acorus gramineus]
MGNYMCFVAPKKPKSPPYNSSFSITVLAPSVQRREGEILQSSNLKKFSLKELKIATRNKHFECIPYNVTFGWIDEHTLKPALLRTGMQVTVHRMPVCPVSFGEHQKWLAKIMYLGKLRHPNLVKLIGYCVKDRTYLVVHEFMPNGRLGGRHFRRSSDFKPLSWKCRIKISLGVAKGLAFLHSVGIVWGNFQTSNVFLDSEYNAKIYEFVSLRHPLSKYSDSVAGQPEYPNPMCDVYSFGVVLLEILSGRSDCKIGRRLDRLDLMDWVARYLNNNSGIIFDPQLEGQYSLMEAQKLISLVFQCIQTKRAYRPSMAQIVKALEALQDG